MFVKDIHDEFKSVDTLTDICCRNINEKDEYYVVIHVTPAVIEVSHGDSAEKPYLTINELSKRLFNREDMLIACIGKLGKDALTVTSLGFNEIRKIRRPLKLAIAPGSISIVHIKDKDVHNRLKDACTYGIGNGICDDIECRKIGFGTIVPIPFKTLPTYLNELINKLIEIITEHKQKTN